MSITSVATTSIRQALRAADPVTTEPEKLEAEIDAPIDPDETNFLPANNGVTGNEPDTNPANWWTDHRRMPSHRPPRHHPEWVPIGGPVGMRIFLWNMFSGCQLLQWGYSIARMTGLHDKGYAMYQIANEW